MKVVVSDQVRKFLAAERKYLRNFSSTASQRLAMRMREAAKLLSKYPMIGAERVLPISGLRRLVVDDYVLDYEVAGQQVHILHMRHGRQRDPYLDFDADFDFEVYAFSSKESD